MITRTNKLSLPIVAFASAPATVLGMTAAVQASPSAPRAGKSVAWAAGTTVSTADGLVCGIVSNGVTEWLGIPYATALAEHVDLNAIRRLVSAALPDWAAPPGSPHQGCARGRATVRSEEKCEISRVSRTNHRPRRSP